MARGIADRKKDRLVLAPRFFKRFGAPRVPIHGIMGVLEQVGTLLVCKLVGVHGIGTRRMTDSMVQHTAALTAKTDGIWKPQPARTARVPPRWPATSGTPSTETYGSRASAPAGSWQTGPDKTAGTWERKTASG